MLASSPPLSSFGPLGASAPMVISRSCTEASSTKMSSTPVLEKSRKVVSSVTLSAGCWPRAASTPRPVASSVPPTQKPSVLIVFAPVISCTTSIARITAFSM